jgi:large subunit ribosomal protein LX
VSGVKRVFRFRGWFKQGLWKQTFEKDLVALSEHQALERLLSDLGSRHKVKRNQIHIEEAREIGPEEVKDPRVLKLLE